jgi:hypothetical protein
MNLKITLLMLFMCVNLINAQSVKSQVLSNQGLTTKLSNGMLITQSVGQTGVIGAFDGFNGSQGFQQLSLVSVIDKNTTINYNLVAYPNPFQSTITVAIPNLESFEKSVFITVSDLSGRTVYSTNQLVENGNVELNIQFLPKAIYLLSIELNKLHFTSKIIKQ